MFLKKSGKPEEYYIVKACHIADIEYINDYISRGKSLDVSHKKNSPLWAAIQWHHLEVVKLLLESGADVNFRLDNTDTVLHRAIDGAAYETFDKDFKGSEPPIDIIQLLIDYGADVNAKDKFGLTPLDLARGLKVSKKCASSVPQNVIDLLKKYTYKAG